MAVNKVVYGDNTLIDLTGDTVTAAKMLSGTTAHDKSGAKITGTILRRAGLNYGDVTSVIEDNSTEITPSVNYDRWIPKHVYTDVVFYIQRQPYLTPDNIKAGATIFGVEGSLEITSGGGDTFTAKNTHASAALVVNGVVVPPNTTVDVPVPPLTIYQMLQCYVLGATITDISVSHNGTAFSAALAHALYGNMMGDASVMSGKMFINQSEVINNGDLLEFTLT